MHFRKLSMLMALLLSAAEMRALAEVPPNSGEEVPARAQESSFANMSDEELWRLLDESGRTAFVGLKAPGRARGVWKTRVLLDKSQWTAAREGVLGVAGVKVLWQDDVLPAVKVSVESLEALRRLRALPFIDYVEPPFKPMLLSGSSSGCFSSTYESMGGVPWDFGSRPQDRISTGDIYPWNYHPHRIQEAWKYGATGLGKKVAVIDTGDFLEQSQLWYPGFSSTTPGRQKTYTWIPSNTNPNQYDNCGHGTRVAGMLAAPRDGVNIVGVAYQAHLHTSEVMNDVVIDQFGADDDKILFGIRGAVENGARIIAMAIGDAFWHSLIADEIRWEYYRTDIPGGVLFVGAAGTYVCLTGVTFPGEMEEVIGVTGRTTTGEVHSSACSGPEADISAVIGDVPSTGRRTYDVIEFGGTSAATSVVAGIAALVWSRYPDWNRDQVRQRLFWSTGQGYRDERWGWGNPDAHRAVGGLYAVHVSGPDIVNPETTYTLTAQPQGGSGSFKYLWSTGATTPSILATSGPEGTSKTLKVTITDLRDGTIREGTRILWVPRSDVDPCARDASTGARGGGSNQRPNCW